MYSGCVNMYIVMMLLSELYIDFFVVEFLIVDVIGVIDFGFIFWCDLVFVYEEELVEKWNVKKYNVYFDGGCVVELKIEDFMVLVVKL